MIWKRTSAVGGVLIAIMAWRPTGLIAEKTSERV